MQDNTRYESYKKPEECPECGSKIIADILYGLPNFPRKLDDGPIPKRTYVIGGCCEEPDSPKWMCGNCRLYIYRENPLRFK
jgi:rubredoxin